MRSDYQKFTYTYMKIIYQIFETKRQNHREKLPNKCIKILEDMGYMKMIW